MLKNKRLLLFSLLFSVLAMTVLGMKVGYPAHRLVAFVLLGISVLFLVVSWQINRRLLRVNRLKIKRKLRPFTPHGIMALLLAVAFYVTWTLIPVEKSPLTERTPQELRAEIDEDVESYQMLLKASDDLVERFKEQGGLQQRMDKLSARDRAEIRSLWRDGIMIFVEFDMLKEKYRGFHQIDYLAQPALHADAFMLAYMVSVAQYRACLNVLDLMGQNDFVETLLNEASEGIPPDTFFRMKQRLTHPNVLLRMNAAAAYYQLIKEHCSLEEPVRSDFERRRRDYLKSMSGQAELFIDNPLDVLEKAAFEALFPIQKNVALQMSYIRTAKRDYLITPELLDQYRPRLQPGDILIQRRNWHMTNIGIPGFWPHVALYVGTAEEIAAFFQGEDFDPMEEIGARYPEVAATLSQSDEEGYPFCVMEAIRPGVVLQSLEVSARCDYLGVIRPNLSRKQIFQALKNACSHVGKPYDLNFDFSTENALVCSELVYKAYRPLEQLPLTPEIISGRRLLSPNRLVEQAVAEMSDGGAFSFVLFLDALEKTDEVVEKSEEDFRTSWERPKWDILQE